MSHVYTLFVFHERTFCGDFEQTTRGPTHWAFRGYAKSEGDGLSRGWARRAYCTLTEAHGRAWQLMAETWLDSTFVTMLSTAWFSRVPCKVLAALTPTAPRVPSPNADLL